MSTLSQRAQGVEALPASEAFSKRYRTGEPQVVWTRLVADLETPVSVYLKLALGKPYSFLLESVEGGASRGRYSVIGLAPDVVWRADGEAAEINRNPVKKPDSFKADAKPALASLRALGASPDVAAIDAAAGQRRVNAAPWQQELPAFLGWSALAFVLVSACVAFNLLTTSLLLWGVWTVLQFVLGAAP